MVSEVFLIGEGEVTNELHALVLFRLLSFFNDTSLYEPIPAGKARSKIVVVLLGGEGEYFTYQYFLQLRMYCACVGYLKRLYHIGEATIFLCALR